MRGLKASEMAQAIVHAINSTLGDEENEKTLGSDAFGDSSATVSFVALEARMVAGPWQGDSAEAQVLRERMLICTWLYYPLVRNHIDVDYVAQWFGHETAEFCVSTLAGAAQSGMGQLEAVLDELSKLPPESAMVRAAALLRGAQVVKGCLQGTFGREKDKKAAEVILHKGVVGELKQMAEVLERTPCGGMPTAARRVLDSVLVEHGGGGA